MIKYISLFRESYQTGGLIEWTSIWLKKKNVEKWKMKKKHPKNTFISIRQQLKSPVRSFGNIFELNEMKWQL